MNSNLYWGTLKKNCCYLPLWRRFSTDCFTDFFVVICMLSVWIPSLFSKGLLPASASLPLTGVINSNLPFGLSPVLSWTLCNERFERVEPHLATFRDTDLLRTLPARARRVALLLRGCSRLWMQKWNRNQIKKYGISSINLIVRLFLIWLISFITCNET